MHDEAENITSLRKGFAIKRAKDLAENARLLLQKDKQIEELRQAKTIIVKEEIVSEKKSMPNYDVRLSEFLYLQFFHLFYFLILIMVCTTFKVN